MIDPIKLLKAFNKNHLNYFTGVPDSVLGGLISLLNSSKNKSINRSAANEGGAVGLATGYYISTSRIPVVYMQNSGLGNAINPLTSIVDNKVFGIPMVLLIGARGSLGIKDEPQHLKMGPITLKVLKVLGIKYKILTKKNYFNQIKIARKTAIKENQPFALVIKPKLIKSLPIKFVKENKKLFKRHDFIEKIIKSHRANDFIVGSTGYTAREIYYYLQKGNKNNQRVFHSIGGMGHSNQVGAEYAAQRKTKRTIVLDGDGAMLMQLGNVSTIKKLNLKNFFHIVFNNNVHESTGGQPISSINLDFRKVFSLFGYKKIYKINTPTELDKILKKKNIGPVGIYIKVNVGSLPNLPRQDRKSLLAFKKLIK